MDLLASLPPGTEQPTDVVSQKILINGTALSEEIGIAQIVVNRSFNKVASARVTFYDGSAADQDFSLSDDNKFKPGSTIKIQLGYHENVDTVFEGIIVKHAIKIRQQGSSLLMIEAKDKAVALTLGRKSAYYINKTDKEAIEAVASKLDPDIQSTSLTHKQLVQFDSTDWDFVITRAEANGMFVLTNDGKLVVKTPATSGKPVLEAIYGKNILEFDAEMDARKQMTNVTSHSWDFNEQSLFDSDAGNANFSESGNLSSDDLSKVLAVPVELNHSGYHLKSELQSWSDSWQLRKQLSKASGRVRIEGNASVMPGNMIKLTGVGDRFNGNVFVTGVMHQYEGYWQTDIQFGWKDDWFSARTDVIDRPASGLLPGVNGLQIAVVQSVDDTDSGQYRIKVKIPVMHKDNEGIWARVATLDAGKNRGVYFRPQKDDEVILGFLNDDPRDPIVLGCLHSKKNHPSPLPEDNGKLQFGIVTDKTKLVFDDSNTRITIMASDETTHKFIAINDESGAMELTDEYANSILMDSNGITISSQKKVVISGNMVYIN